MAFKRVLSEEAGPVEGVIDTGVVVIAHFDNPAREVAFEFFGRFWCGGGGVWFLFQLLLVLIIL